MNQPIRDRDIEGLEKLYAKLDDLKGAQVMCLASAFGPMLERLRKAEAAQLAVRPTVSLGCDERFALQFQCPRCFVPGKSGYVFERDNYCQDCGAKLRWE